MLGGFGNLKPADPEAQGIADTVRPHVEQQLGRSFQHYQVHGYTTQVVAGTNYKLKVAVENNEFIHMKVFKPLPHTGEHPQLNECAAGKTEADALN